MHISLVQVMSKYLQDYITWMHEKYCIPNILLQEPMQIIVNLPNHFFLFTIHGS